ncbi:30S ribosomal protein S19e [Metallosphaera sp. J1]|uniref:30S ribosomal protein S19e n=1 Tax=Metallosphaera TaxID=41980 RepID=UPI001EDE6E3A|nr:30S ribosomal protein S19e [Metallosphaera javensis (ex Hofmann et al. 2022)]MCG3109537.1 30S ribosomal protein S19e [Metallosphaera javensis (ex Hofmann et al. 2022)]BCS94127.1 MAG: 30S ribosomal protein S19e [Metallosphaera javensis (ex Sakai et al. 2022)]
MITANMVPPDLLVKRLSDYIKNNVSEVQPPDWSLITKTASFKERIPDDPQSWWYMRAASILRKLYVLEHFGVSESTRLYGGLKRRGTKPPVSARAPGHSTRLLFQQLERAGLVAKTRGVRKGRVLTPKGRSLLDKMAHEIFIDLANNNPALKKYLE